MELMMIGFRGKKEAGKDTAMNALRGKCRNGEVVLRFADPLKQAVAVMYQWPEHLLQGDTLESRQFREKKDSFWGITPREALCHVGTDLVRKYDNDFWVKNLERRLLQIMGNPLKQGCLILIPDVRFPNEMEMIKRYHGQIWYIERPELEEKEKNKEQHLSELFAFSDDQWNDLVFVNDTTITDLQNKIIDAYVNLLKKRDSSE